MHYEVGGLSPPSLLHTIQAVHSVVGLPGFSQLLAEGKETTMAARRRQR
jgi:hypothetical protein